MADKHTICDVSNGLGIGNASMHKNVKISVDMDNGCIVELGDLATGEMEAFEGKEPTASSPLNKLALIKAPEIMKDDRLKSLADFYNKAGQIVRAYLFHDGFQFRMTKEGFDGTPAVGSIVEAGDGYKMKVVASATGGSTQIGKIIAVEGNYFVVAV